MFTFPFTFNVMGGVSQLTAEKENGWGGLLHLWGEKRTRHQYMLARERVFIWELRKWVTVFSVNQAACLSDAFCAHCLVRREGWQYSDALLSLAVFSELFTRRVQGPLASFLEPEPLQLPSRPPNWSVCPSAAISHQHSFTRYQTHAFHSHPHICLLLIRALF